VSRGLERDRVVDETGGQTVVFGRRGSRPFHLDEMRPFYEYAPGELFKVEDVSTRDGKLVTRSGAPLAEPKEFSPPAEPSPTPLPEPRNLFR
jgi:hypothetical protein